MKDESKKCYNCGNFRAYYTKGELQFNKSDYGECRSSSYAVCDKHGCCDNWRTKPNRWGIPRKKSLAKSRLVDILNQLADIRQILQEDKDGE